LLSLLFWLPLSLLSVREASAQGTVMFNNHILGTGGQTTHIWGSPLFPNFSFIGLGSNDSPSGTTPFSDWGMSLIGAGGSGGHYGYATTFAQLIGAVGSNQPESSLMPIGQVTTFRSGTALGNVAIITDTLGTAGSAWQDAPFATFELVAWDNSSGLYPTWSQASIAWMTDGTGLAAGRSQPFTVSAIGGVINTPPNLNNMQQLTSFNLYWLPEPSSCALAGLGLATLLSFHRRK
jgi:hypothetical protein